MKKLFQYFLIVLSIVQVLFLASCEVKRPAGVFSKGKMEDILYDYHIACTLAENGSYEQMSYRKALYVQSVFKKHDVTEAQFDSSLHWYCRNADKMAEIYEDVQKRMQSDIDDMNKLITTSQRTSDKVAASGDSIDLWSFSRVTRLTGDDMSSHLTFLVNSDSTFHQRDALEWSVNVLNPAADVSHMPIMELTVQYANDSTVSRRVQITGSGNYNLRVQSELVCDIRSVKGFIYFPKGSNGALVLKINYLKRFHAHGKPATSTPTAPGMNPPNQMTPNANNAPGMFNNGKSPVPVNNAVAKPASKLDTLNVINTLNHRIKPEELNRKQDNAEGKPRGYQVRQQALEKELLNNSKNKKKNVKQ